MRTNAYLVYGIIPSAQIQLDARDIEGGHDFVLLRHHQIMAVASRVDVAMCDEEVMRQRSEDMRWLLPRVQAYEQVIAHVFSQTTIIPFRFGTIFCNRNRLKEMLSDREAAWLVTLNRLAGGEEWGLKVFGDLEGRLTSRLAQKEASLRREGIGPGRLHFLKKKLRQVALTEVEAELDHLAQTGLQTIADYGYEMRPGRVDSKTAHKDGKLLLTKLVFLVPKAGRSEFLSHIAEAQTSYAISSLEITLNGPWAPYSFAQDDKRGDV